MPVSFRSSDVRRAVADVRALPPDDRLALLTLGALLPIIRLSLRTFSFRRTRDALAWSSASRDASPVTGEAIASARRLVELAGIAGRRGPIRATCLPQSLSVWWCLRRRGLPAELRIGTTGTSAAFSAHAWVELAGVVLDDSADPSRAFEPLPPRRELRDRRHLR